MRSLRADMRPGSEMAPLVNASQTPPSVAVVVPVRNEIAHVERLVAELRAQDYPGLREIWMVDGESNDGTYEAIERLTAADCRFILFRNHKRLPAAAVNYVVDRTTADVVMRIDAHATYDFDVVSQSVAALLSTGAAGVGAIARPADGDTMVARAIVAAHRSPFGVGVAAFRKEGASGWVDTVWNGCYWKRILDEIGPLREDLARAEDNDLNQRIRRRGYGLFLSPDIRARYQPRQTIVSLWRQYLATGAGVARALIENRNAIKLRHLAPLTLVVGLIASLLLAIAVPEAAAASYAVFLAYGLILTIATIHAARAGAGQHLLLLPLVLVTVHISYGLGSLGGLAASLAPAGFGNSR